jgi:hypothetical protein
MIRKNRTPLASRFLLCALSSIFLLATNAPAQQGPGNGPPPPPNRSTPVEANELRETWNDRVSQGPPVGAMPGVRRDGAWGLRCPSLAPSMRSLNSMARSGCSAAIRPGGSRPTSSRYTIRHKAAGRSDRSAPADPSHHGQGGQRQALCDRWRNRRREHWTSREIRGGRLGSRSERSADGSSVRRCQPARAAAVRR